MFELCENSVWNICGIPDAILNLSTYVLTKAEQQVLSLGLSFALKPENNIALDFVAATINRFDSSWLGGMIMGGLMNHFNSMDSIPKRFRTALDSLSKNKDIFITKSDKSNTVVILNKSEYLNKMNNLLSDSTTYEKLHSSPLKRLASEFNKKVRDLLHNIPNLEAKQFIQINPKLPYIYGLPKTHKENIPLRPIISQSGSFTYKLSQFLAKKLAPVVGTVSRAHIKNSSDFIEKIKSLDLFSGKMVSFDVDSLFTKVPINDVLDFLASKLPNCDVDLGMPVSTFLELVKLCVTSNAFSFEDNFYMQCFGMGMGSPLSPILCNLYMEYYESELLPRVAPTQLIWFRYVDDIFSFWPSTFNNFEEFFANLNNLAPSIKFKVEWEHNGILPFLDVVVMKKSDSLSFKVYRKPTSCNLFIHFFSYHHSATKLSIISTMFLRAFRICSPENLKEEKSTIWKIFLNLKYPPWFIKKAYLKARQSYFTPKPQNDVKKRYITVPYITSLDIVKSACHKQDVNVAFKYTSTIKSMLVRNKNKNICDAGIYKIPCQDCELVYIGETGRNLETRIKEHKYAVKSHNKNNALFHHKYETDHRINWQGSHLMYKCHDFRKRKIIESMCIQKFGNFNLSEGTYKLDPVTRSLIDKSLPPISEGGS